MWEEVWRSWSFVTGSESEAQAAITGAWGGLSWDASRARRRWKVLQVWNINAAQVDWGDRYLRQYLAVKSVLGDGSRYLNHPLFVPRDNSTYLLTAVARAVVSRRERRACMQMQVRHPPRHSARSARHTPASAWQRTTPPL